MLPFALDFASVDGNTQREYVKTKAAGLRAVIIRGAYGRRVQSSDVKIYLDPRATDMPIVRAAGLRTGSYLFVCVPKKGATTPEPEVQVDAWLDYVEPLTLKHGDIVGGIDLEEDSDILNADQLYTWYERAAQRYRARMGCWPNFYTSDRYWTEEMKDHAPGVFAKCPPWIAKPWPWDIRTPIQLGDTPSSPRLIPEFGNNWFLYQRQGDATGAPGFNRTTDVNVIRQFGVGAKGDHVKMLQRWLNASPAKPDPLLLDDGDFGGKTKAALEAAQSYYNGKPLPCSVDGVFGLQSLCALSWVDLGDP